MTYHHNNDPYEFGVAIANEISHAFDRSPHAEVLASMPRFGRFVPAGYDAERWTQTIGPHGNVRDHMRESVQEGLRVLRHENNVSPRRYSHEEIALVLATLAMHDQGERWISDKPFHRKTVADERNELESLLKHQPSLTEDMSGTALQYYKQGRDRLLFGDEDDELVGLVRTAERIGYLNAALGAFSLLKIANGDGALLLEHIGLQPICDAEPTDILRVLDRLAIEVVCTSGVTSSLLRSDERFSSGAEYLLERQNEIDELMQAINPPVSFEWYESDDEAARPDEVTIRTSSFHNERAAWDTFKSTCNIG